jgi:putative acetyltransferase
MRGAGIGKRQFLGDKSIAQPRSPSYGQLVLIREEQCGDYDDVATVHAGAFGSHGAVVVPLVADLRNSLASEAGLSLVAIDDHGSVAGHVLFTRSLLDAPRQLVDVQVLSPVGVLPVRQRSGVGSSLIRHGLDMLTERGVPLVFLEGSPDYYPRFGFSPGHEHNFRRPSLRIPKGAFQVRLLSAYEPWMTGTLVYRQTFWNHDAVGLRDGG